MAPVNDRAFELCVIGSGPAGRAGALEAAAAGRRTCLVERAEAVGGIAVHTGTIPAQALREAILRLRGRQTAAPRVDDFRADRFLHFEELLAACREVARNEGDLARKELERAGVTVVRGQAAFAGPHVVEVTRASGGTRIEAPRFLVAVGTVASELPGIVPAGSGIVGPDGLLRLPSLPRSLAVVGGGLVGVEIASMMAALGSAVTLVEARDPLLDVVDGECASLLREHLRAAGAVLRLGERVVHAEVLPDGSVEARLDTGRTIRAEVLVAAGGRRGATSGLNLAAVGLEANGRGRLLVDENQRTAVPHVYAAGDVVGSPSLASTSAEQGRRAVRHMYGRPAGPRGPVPRAVWTVPELASVGPTEEALSASGLAFVAGRVRFRDIPKARLIGEEAGFLKLLVDARSRAVLGAHLFGSGAAELVHVGQLAVALGAPADLLAETVSVHPTLAEGFRLAARRAVDALRGC